MSEMDTIFALSSGALPSGVAVIRISGTKTRFGLETLGLKLPEPRHAVLRTIRNQNNLVIDKGLVIFFPNPHSFTGEDCAEIHLHGGRAVVQALFDALSLNEGFRFAEAGEFTKRAFDNGKMDLTEAEGLADLISSETEMQRRLAIQQAQGGLRELYNSWATKLLHSRALIEAELDFSDEEDIPGSVSDQVWADMAQLSMDISSHLDQSGIGEISRSGFSIVLAGAPNAGKSSLLNALAGRDVAIVSDEMGTTRDVLEVRLDLGGYLVILKDTAGLRDTTSTVELEGIRRAKGEFDQANLVLVLEEPNQNLIDKPIFDDLNPSKILHVATKSDYVDANWLAEPDIFISTRDEESIEKLIDLIKIRLSEATTMDELVVPTRQRHIDLLVSANQLVTDAVEQAELPIELRSEYLRSAQENLGRITGRVDVEDLLGVIFGEFCVGK